MFIESEKHILRKFIAIGLRDAEPRCSNNALSCSFTFPLLFKKKFLGRPRGQGLGGMALI
jgi:hypothetical protein